MRRPLLPAGFAVLTALTWTAFWPILGNGFVNLDDVTFVVRNNRIAQGLTGESIHWALTHAPTGSWFPLAWMSHALDISLFGLSAGGHHLTSLLLHNGTAALLFLVLASMTGATGRSFVVAAIFAVHPLQVESVAWVSERSNVLSTFFWMLTLATYLRYTRRPNRGRYLLMAACFSLGLMSKPMVVTLPLTLLLLDFWPLARFAPVLTQRSAAPNTFRRGSLWQLLAEKIPLLLLSGIVAVVTFLSQRTSGAMSSLEWVSVPARLKNALLSYVRYPLNAIWPGDLHPFYLHLRDAIPLEQAAGAGLLLGAVSWATIRAYRRRPSLAVGWLWYLVVLFPVIGLVQVGDRAYADRYAYFSFVGLSLGVAWLLPSRLANRSRRYAAVVLVAALLGTLAAISNRQCRMWRDSSTLAGSVLARHPDNFLARDNLANTLFQQGDDSGAIHQLLILILQKPSWGGYRYNLALVLQHRGDPDGAVHHLNAALRLDPGEPKYLRKLEEIRAGKRPAGNPSVKGGKSGTVRPEHVEGLL